MKKQKSAWWQPEGWMTFGAYIVVGLLLLYLIFVIGRLIAPRLRSINKMYNSACITRFYRA
ncbi:MAG TPA: hypothetical protein VHR86_02160 [Armatimonadota bacterium]|nr:hypothetical protein [Armatimonadota bacterium]